MEYGEQNIHRKIVQGGTGFQQSRTWWSNRRDRWRNWWRIERGGWDAGSGWRQGDVLNVWMSAGDVGRYVRADQSKELAQLGSLNRLGPPGRYALLSFHVPKTNPRAMPPSTPGRRVWPKNLILDLDISANRHPRRMQTQRTKSFLAPFSEMDDYKIPKKKKGEREARLEHLLRTHDT
jgi:hypothetical protein